MGTIDNFFSVFKKRAEKYPQGIRKHENCFHFRDSGECNRCYIWKNPLMDCTRCEDWMPCFELRREKELEK